MKYKQFLSDYQSVYLLAKFSMLNKNIHPCVILALSLLVNNFAPIDR